MADSALVYCTKLIDTDFRKFTQHEMLDLHKAVGVSLEYSESCRSGKFQMLCSEAGEPEAENGVVGAEGPSSRAIKSDAAGSTDIEKRRKRAVDIVPFPRTKLQRKGNDAHLQVKAC